MCLIFPCSDYLSVCQPICLSGTGRFAFGDDRTDGDGVILREIYTPTNQSGSGSKSSSASANITLFSGGSKGNHHKGGNDDDNAVQFTQVITPCCRKKL